MVRSQQLTQQYMKFATAKFRWYNAKHREGMCVCFQKYCIARAVVHENVRTPHTLTEHVQFARAAAPISVGKYGWNPQKPWMGMRSQYFHTICIQDRPHLPCSVAIKLQPPTDFLHYTPMQHYTNPTAFHNLPQPSYAHNTRHSWQDGTRYRDGVKLLWCHFHGFLSQDQFSRDQLPPGVLPKMSTPRMSTPRMSTPRMSTPKMSTPKILHIFV